MWSIEQVKQLTALWAEGFSAEVVAAEIGDGVTRNAVLGKVHRLKLPERMTLKVARRKAPKRPRRREPMPRPRERVNIRPRPFRQPPHYSPATRSQLYAMLADAVRNTAAMQEG